jgi:hypothetical protein
MNALAFDAHSNPAGGCVKKLSSLSLIIALVACQGQSVPWGSNEQISARSQIQPPEDGNCTNKSDQHRIRKKGGTEYIPALPASGQFDGQYGGQSKYARLSREVGSEPSVFSCLYNQFNIPVPANYTADWFGAWSFCSVPSSRTTQRAHRDRCAFTFESGNLYGQISAEAWSPSTTYYLYVYTARSGTFIESYPIGPVTIYKPKTQKLPSLQFASPFENNFAWPTGDFVALEIVHPTP